MPVRTAYVPVVGRIAAGSPVLADEVVEDVFPLPRALVGEGALFLLRVTGDSMAEAAICDGDWVVVRQQPVADNGEIVAALIENEATVKVFRRQGSEAWLLPRNAALSADLRSRSDHPGQGGRRTAPGVTGWSARRWRRL